MKYQSLLMGIVVWAAAALPTLPAGAVEVVLQTDADADIRSADLADNSYNRTVMVVGNGANPDPATGRNYKAYMRFALPNNIDTVNSATFTISRAVSGAWNFAYYAFGLNDGVSGETDWIEANEGGISWNSAPGNDPNSASDFLDATPIGSFSVLGVNNGGPTSGDSYQFSTQELADFINADTNGYVTIMLSRYGSGSTSSDQFAARTGSGTVYPVPGPTLTLEYSVKHIPGDFNEDGFVDGVDFLWWQRGFSPSPLSGSDLADWKASYGPGASTVAASTVPEPGVAAMFIVVATAGICIVRRRPRFTDLTP